MLFLEGTEEQKNRLADAMLSVHFFAAAQDARLECLEAREASAYLQIDEAKAQLAEAEAEGAVQRLKWREEYMAEAEEANNTRNKLTSSSLAFKLFLTRLWMQVPRIFKLNSCEVR
jgi:hypothetical protein